MMTNRIKDQGKEFKAKSSRYFPCALNLAPCASRPAFSTYQRGFSLVSAIFLLVVIAALGTFAVTLSTTQQQSAAMDVMGARAYQAARAGIEWAAYRVSATSSGEKWDGCTDTVPAAQFPANTLGGTLSPFTVTVNCAAASHVDGTPIWIYTVSSVAQTGGSAVSPGYIERVISVKMGK